MLVDFIRQPLRTQETIKQGLKIGFDLEVQEKSQKIKISFSQVPDQDGIFIHNYSQKAPAFIIDVVIAATRIKKNIEVFEMIVGPGELRHRSLYPENLKFDCSDSTCFKLRIRPLGFDNVSLIAKTIFRGCLPNNNDVFGRSEFGYESMGDSYMHINMEGDEFKHGV